MDRKFLKDLKVEGLDGGLPADIIDAIMKEYGTSIQAKDQEIETLKTEKDGLSTQLKEANTKIEGFKDVDVNKLNEEIESWKTKYNTDTENLKNEISKKDYDFKINDIVKDIQFSSNGARKSFIEDLKAKNFKFEDDKLVGYSDFLKSYKENDPDAFKKVDDGKKMNLGGDHKDNPPKNEVSTLAGALHEKYDK
jgi:hypothetical protein